MRGVYGVGGPFGGTPVSSLAVPGPGRPHTQSHIGIKPNCGIVCAKRQRAGWVPPASCAHAGPTRCNMDSSQLPPPPNTPGGAGTTNGVSFPLATWAQLAAALQVCISKATFGYIHAASLAVPDVRRSVKQQALMCPVRILFAGCGLGCGRCTATSTPAHIISCACSSDHPP